MLNRRNFILTGASSLFFATLPPLSMASSLLSAAPRKIPLPDSKLQDNLKIQFAKQISDRYLAWNQNGSMLIKLADVAPGPLSPGILQFYLTFEGPGSDKSNGLYQIAHLKSDQQHQIYLEQVEDSHQYRAVFCLFERQS